jgi:hypothetical protein
MTGMQVTGKKSIFQGIRYQDFINYYHGGKINKFHGIKTTEINLVLNTLPAKKFAII